MTASSRSQTRQQQTIKKSVSCRGIGFITGAEIEVHFHPAHTNTGIQFQRTDQAGLPVIPALVEYCVPRQRRTALQNGECSLELTEHVLAALAGLQIDNCLVEVSGVELPGGDGSSLIFTEPLLEAGIEVQSAPRQVLVIDRQISVKNDQRMELFVRPANQAEMQIGYQLDYGPRSPIFPQVFHLSISPETFQRELAASRTFVLQDEVEALRALGYGKRTTYQDLLVYGPEGVIDNKPRFVDECVRHKMLDCVGDFALLGCDIHGYFQAYRSGHELNRKLIRQIRTEYRGELESGSRQKVA
ncbi:UDP-3-O-[3-hydroxymyristoyl] N-acetylglucosamine deacetylase [Polystyrenella longa]|uniref:UDP-3-O-acyl-N-acetylglucosamine deacetylase n=1 Tax=Polystyrenella longa TaxID=2528007 RepID=A0A518CRD0_9PLAN|nr:UDP-3-O-acyl-N-acetylglucosamine deacetylase [Polystyrenella longa]QDU81768.1 UDP-3-O-[3-hydroxymyristoyl] N-acetylglucosamine deacetylase [Polystyrenella longa]